MRPKPKGAKHVQRQIHSLRCTAHFNVALDDFQVGLLESLVLRAPPQFGLPGILQKRVCLRLAELVLLGEKLQPLDGPFVYGSVCWNGEFHRFVFLRLRALRWGGRL